MTADDINDDTVVPMRRSEARSTPRAGVPDTDDTISSGHAIAAVAREALQLGQDTVIDGDTVALPRRVDRVVSPVPAPAEGPAEAPSAPVAEQPASSPAPLRLRLPNGTIAPVDRPTVLGRNPRASRIPVDPPPAFVTLSSPSREISASHAVIEPVGDDAIVVTDLHSANGTTVLLPTGTSRLLVAGDSAVVPVGTILMFGEGNAITVLSPVRHAAGTAAESGVAS